ncbi:promotilin isoform X1 [Felis catus]|uniref:promotilin isoform X1 n=1 Tax=Felis catus TaxID=9685 RepID=UPI001D19E950|nr:promotilin isoform X1 [Felis catus]
MVSRKAVAVLLMVHVAVMLASQTEAFVPIFTHSELQRIREKERNKGQKKSLIVQQRSEEVGPLDPVEPPEEEENEVIKLTAPVAIGTRMNSRQLEKYRAALEGLLSEVLLPARNDRVFPPKTPPRPGSSSEGNPAAVWPQKPAFSLSVLQIEVLSSTWPCPVQGLRFKVCRSHLCKARTCLTNSH